MSKEFLRKLPLFANLPDEDLDRLYDMAELFDVPAGVVLMEEGQPGDDMYVVLDGLFEVTKESGGHDLLIAECHPGEVLGEMSLLEAAPRSATVRAIAHGKLLRVSRTAFQQLLGSSPTAAQALLKTVMIRLRNTESVLMQHQKLAELGMMSAGVAHELNNPASAVQRSADQLQKALSGWQHAILALDANGLDGAYEARLEQLRAELEQQAASPMVLDPLDTSDREGAILDWLDGQGIENAWELAPALVQLGWQLARLEEVVDGFPTEQRPAVAAWLGTTALIFGLLHDLMTGADRISQTVLAVKRYSHRDQAPIAEVDIHEGLENTLIILRYKLKEGVTVHREYDQSLPHIEAYPGDLNQVWTNLIDNAIQAMGRHGDIWLRTYARDSQVVVEVCDSGPGIPPDIQSQIFEPFFTTKPQGEGSGLGLHLVHNIVVLKHGGRIDVDSRPGHTCFTITLPVRLLRNGNGTAPA